MFPSFARSDTSSSWGRVNMNNSIPYPFIGSLETRIKDFDDFFWLAGYFKRERSCHNWRSWFNNQIKDIKGYLPVARQAFQIKTQLPRCSGQSDICALVISSKMLSIIKIFTVILCSVNVPAHWGWMSGQSEGLRG